MRVPARAVGAAVLALSLAGITVASSSASASSSPATSASRHHIRTRLCQVDGWKWAGSGQFILYNDVLEQTDHECVSNVGDKANFRIAKSTTPQDAWNAYPNLFAGCEYGNCSKTSPVPVQLDHLTHLSMTLYSRFWHGIGDDATDFWFTKKYPFRSKVHPNGAELMIWLAWRGVPKRNCEPMPHIDGWHWCVEDWRTFLPNDPSVSWNYIQIRWRGRHRHPSVTQLNILPLIHYAEHLGLIKHWWWASSFDAGFELIHGGVGDGILKYSLEIHQRKIAEA
jgi:hypothetical protein